MKYFNIFIFILLSFSFLNCTIKLPGYGNQTSHFNLSSLGSESDRSDSDYFYLDLNKSHYRTSGTPEPLYEMSTSEEYGDSDGRKSVSNCEIEHNPRNDGYEDPTEDIMCIMDIMEQDFYTGTTSVSAGNSGRGRDLVLSFNVPGGMCSLVTIRPSWHYNQKIGSGARFIYECEKPAVEASSGDATADEEAVQYACVSNKNAVCLAPHLLGEGYYPKGLDNHDVYCSSTVDIKDFQSCKSGASEIGVEVFNEEGIGLGNCCFGTYLDKEGQKNSFGGDFNSCIGGPARHSWPLEGNISFGDVEFEGVPTVAVIQVKEEGLRQDIPIKSLLSVTQQRFSIPITNYLEEFDVQAKDLKRITREDLPEMFQSQTLVQGDLPAVLSPAPEPLWTFSCLDSAGEVVHQMHLMIREWNTYEDFIEFYEEGGNDDSDPDVIGDEGEQCAYEERELLGNVSQCNDFYDLEDFQNGEYEELSSRVYPRIRYKDDDSSGGSGE